MTVRALTKSPVKEQCRPLFSKEKIMTTSSLYLLEEGAGVHSTLFSNYIGFGENKTNFDGEIKSLLTGLE